MSQQPRSTFVLFHPSEILQALVGPNDVAVVCLERRGPEVELMIGQVVGEVLPACRPVQNLGRTIRAWFDKIANFHLARVTNGPTESLNNLIKRIGFGFHNFENYRIRALLYAGKPNWSVLGSIVVR